MRRLTDEGKCAAALGEYTDLLLAGRAPSIDLFLRANADIEERLRPLLESAVALLDGFEALRRRKAGRKSKKEPGPR